MPDPSIAQQHHATFEGIRHVDEDGKEFWLARPLAKVLDYSEYRHFLPVVERAREACRNSGHPVADHFEDILEMVEIGSGAKRALPENLPEPKRAFSRLNLGRKSQGKKLLPQNPFVRKP